MSIPRRDPSLRTLDADGAGDSACALSQRRVSYAATQPHPPDLTSRVDLWSTALVVPTGHNVRVTVSASAGATFGTPVPSPLYGVNPQNDDEYIGGLGIPLESVRSMCSAGELTHRPFRSPWPLPRNSAAIQAPEHHALP